ncbi:MAG: peptide-methionine (S)-S-oxide reductase MsrA [Flavobacteriaceae bacterium]|nr:peptide-methionine (S)-S-oxide reductase MsrA [Flavobacteriaceae bacterium]
MIVNPQNDNITSTATFAGGCFWCTEAIFEQLKGVKSVISGYSGGNIKNPAYREVVTGRTGHAEAIQISYDPKVISYTELLDVFFSTHNPTTLNRQGYDVGTQYRSVIFYHNNTQKEEAKKMIRDLTKAEVYDAKIVTEVNPFKAFYKAEDYHQDYYDNNKTQPYCENVINPKLRKFLEKYTSKIKEE